jgi:hypothetical protein
VFTGDQVKAYAVDGSGRIFESHGKILELIGMGRATYSASTLGGSSGFPVLGKNGKVKLIHTRSETQQSNSGTYITPFLKTKFKPKMESYATTADYERAELWKRIEESRFANYEEYREHYRIKIGLDVEDQRTIMGAVMYYDNSFFNVISNDREYATKAETAEAMAQWHENKHDMTLAQIEQVNQTLEDKQRQREADEEALWEDTRGRGANSAPVDPQSVINSIAGDMINRGDDISDFVYGPESGKPLQSISDRLNEKAQDEQLAETRLEMKQLRKLFMESQEAFRKRDMASREAAEQATEKINLLKHQRQQIEIDRKEAKELAAASRLVEEEKLEKLKQEILQTTERRKQEDAAQQARLASIQEALNPTPPPSPTLRRPAAPEGLSATSMGHIKRIFDGPPEDPGTKNTLTDHQHKILDTALSRATQEQLKTLNAAAQGQEDKREDSTDYESEGSYFSDSSDAESDRDGYTSSPEPTLESSSPFRPAGSATRPALKTAVDVKKKGPRGPMKFRPQKKPRKQKQTKANTAGTKQTKNGTEKSATTSSSSPSRAPVSSSTSGPAKKEGSRRRRKRAPKAQS